MDQTQLAAVIDYMIGCRTLGGTSEDSYETPNSPELRAFIVARLGSDIPSSGYRIVVGRGRNELYTRQGKAMAGLLREIADGIDPPETAEAA